MPKKIRHMEELNRISFLIVLVGIVAILGIYCINKGTSDIAVINGQTISKEEYALIMNKEKPKVFSLFSEKYNLDKVQNFWTHRFKEGVPEEILKSKTLDRLIRIKVIQKLLLSKGIINSSSFDVFLEDLKKENERRKKLLENNEPIYGPVEFEIDVYYDYLLSENEDKLVKKLSDEELGVTPEAIKDYYSKNISNYNSNIPKLEVEQLDMTVTQTDLEKVQDDIAHLLSEGKGLKEISKTYLLDAKYEKIAYEAKLLSDLALKDKQIYNLLMSLNKGDIRSAIKEDGRLYYVKVLQKEYLKDKDISQVYENVKDDYRKEKYKEYIDKTVQAAKVEINTRILNKVRVN